MKILQQQKIILRIVAVLFWLLRLLISALMKIHLEFFSSSVKVPFCGSFLEKCDKHHLCPRMYSFTLHLPIEAADTS